MSDEPLPKDKDIPIIFDNFEDAWSRSSSRSTALEECYDNFQVFGLKWFPGKSEPQTVFPNYNVTHNGTGWEYLNLTLNQSLKYWDLSAERYLFSAVTPTPDNSPTASDAYRYTTVTMGSDGNIGINNIRGNVGSGDFTNSTHSPDWMVAQTERWALPLVDLNKISPSISLHESPNYLTAMTDNVPLSFHHIMARTDVLIWSTTPIILQNFKIEVNDAQPIISLANWSSQSGWTDKTAPDAHKPMIFGDYTYIDGKTVSDNEEKPTLIMSHVQIPQNWLDTGRSLRVTITTTDATVYQGTMTLNTSTHNTNSWDENKQYRYIIKINTDNGENNLILFAVDMDTWKWKEGSSIEDVQTGW